MPARAGAGCWPARRFLPQTLQLAASFSADATVLGLVFSFTALCLRLRLQPARRWQLALLVALALAIGPAKAIYLPVVLLLCLVPAAHLDPRGPQAAPLRLGRVSLRAGTLVKALALALAAAGWAALNLGAVLYATRDVDNVGLTRAAVAVAIAAAVLGLCILSGAAAVRWAAKSFSACSSPGCAWPCRWRSTASPTCGAA